MHVSIYLLHIVLTSLERVPITTNLSARLRQFLKFTCSCDTPNCLYTKAHVWNLHDPYILIAHVSKLLGVLCTDACGYK